MFNNVNEAKMLVGRSRHLLSGHRGSDVRAGVPSKVPSVDAGEQGALWKCAVDLNPTVLTNSAAASL